MTKAPSSYIPSIDGLRAIAVSLVLLFHVKIPFLMGGYIGVDVFFVISGFLITRGIIGGSEKGHFTFRNFYIRRAVRLFPALFATILATLVAGFFILSPAALEEMSGSALAATLFFANIFFALDAGYFDTASHLKPLLHMWSLSVEEQFYLVWPVTVIVLLKVLKAKAKYAIPIIGLLSFAAAVWYEPQNANFVFFMTPFRIFQFCIGAALAFWAFPRVGHKQGYIGIASMVLLVAWCIWIGDRITGVIPTALVPAALTGVFIATARSSILDAVFASKIAVWLGRRSYSIYLVHWPIIVYFGIKTGFDFSLLDQAILVTVSLVLGAALYNFVEEPLRIHGKQSLRENKLKLAGVVLPMVAAVSISAVNIQNQGFPSRIPDDVDAVLAKVADGWVERKAEIRSGTCSINVVKEGFDDWNRETCAEPDTSRPNVFVIGDSYSGGTYMSFKRAYPEVNFLQLSVPGCRLKLPENMPDEGKYADCKRLYSEFFNELLPSESYDAVIFRSNWLPNHHTDLGDMITAAKGSNTPSVLIGQRLAFSEKLPDLLGSSFSLDDAQRKATERTDKANVKWNEFYKTRYGPDASVFVDFLELACAPECAIFTPDNRVIILDDRHLSKVGSQIMAAKIRRNYFERLDPIFKATALSKSAGDEQTSTKKLSMQCSAIGSAAGFTREYNLTGAGNRFSLNRKSETSSAFETWDVNISDESVATITGEYQEGAGGLKTISFEGIVHDEILIAEGTRGPRSCYIAADLTPASDLP